MISSDYIYERITFQGIGRAESARKELSTMREKSGKQVMSVRAGDIDISCELYGEGPPLLLIIGLGGVKEMWGSAFVEPLSEDFTVISFDSRGMGGTEPGGGEFSISLMASDAANLLGALGIERAHVLGYSMGGYVAQELALEQPSLVDRLVLLGTECGGAGGVRVEPGVLIELTGSQGRGTGETSHNFFFSAEWLASNKDRLHDLFGAPGHGQGHGNAARQADAMREWNGTCARLPEIGNPTLVITGTRDIVILPENARVLSELLPHSVLVEMDGGDHGLILQFPAQLARIVSDFLLSPPEI